MIESNVDDTLENPGRDVHGRFARGNRGGPGNPYSRRVASFRRALYEAVTVRDIEQLARRLVAMALSGDLRAIREVLDRVLGPSVPADLIERLEEMEGALGVGRE